MPSETGLDDLLKPQDSHTIRVAVLGLYWRSFSKSATNIEHRMLQWSRAITSMQHATIATTLHHRRTSYRKRLHLDSYVLASSPQLAR